MTNCNKPTFPLICNDADFSEPFHNTGEQIYYQKIDPVHASHVDGVVLLERNGNYYKAIYTENTINIEWYRCLYTNPLIDNDEAMITQAIKTAAYLGATLRFDAREYIVNRQLEFQNLSCFKLLGDRQHTWIKSDSKKRFEGFYFSFIECSNIIIEGFQFDLNKSNIEVYSSADDVLSKEFNGGILIKGDPLSYLSYNIEITNCHFHDLYNRAIRFYGCSQGHIIVTNNLFESGLQQQIYMMEHLVVSQSHSANVTIENNIFRNAENHDSSKAPCAIYGFDLGSYGSVLISNNYFEYCGRDNTGHHRLFAIDFYDNVNNFIISNNSFKNTTWGAIRFDGTRMNAVITDNYIHQLITNDSGIINSSTREIPGKVVENFSICNNIIESAIGDSYGILLQSQVNTTILDNINISNNTFNHLKTAVLMGGSVNNVNISNNIATNMSGIVVDFKAHNSAHTYFSGEIVSSIHSVKIPLGRVMITHNNFRSVSEGFTGIQIDGISIFSQQNLDLYKDSTKRFVISDNLLYGYNKGYGIIINSVGEIWPAPIGSDGKPLPVLGFSLDGKVTVSANEVNDLWTGLYLRVPKVIAKDNIIFNCSNSAINDDGITNHIKLNNYYNNAPV
ncbi:right-handed parallel beta-helix repeat-containing protein [Chryseobacterium arthrosphaerae]|uniref:right-handed parallel beta-helix repeat-containing protein n=1 Tax=Chryseobacterium arthrosphaerae TaxID=651561 RepID=UPI0031D8A78F